MGRQSVKVEFIKSRRLFSQIMPFTESGTGCWFPESCEGVVLFSCALYGRLCHQHRSIGHLLNFSLSNIIYENIVL